MVERCLYGVDRNPLAVEMAKLSLWLLTLQRNRPFTFLDHAIRCGDSLLGVDLKQLSTWSLSGEGRQHVLFDDDLSFAADKREGLMKMQYRTGDQRRLLDAALARTRRLRAAADRLIATAFEANPEASAAAVSMALEEQEVEAQKMLEGNRPFHWPVEFPEVFLHSGGFDAIVGNPPFMGGTKLEPVFGSAWRRYLVEYVGCDVRGLRGTGDLCAYFFLRAEQLLKQQGCFGLIGSNTISQGDTRELGLEQLVKRGCCIIRAVASMPWPGAASLEVAQVWVVKGRWNGQRWLDGANVSEISLHLRAADANSSRENPYSLDANADQSFEGVKILGLGFLVSRQEAQDLISRRSDNARVLYPYLGGDDLNSQPDRSPTRWVIHFRNWPLDRDEIPEGYSGPVAGDYPECLEIVAERVKPERLKYPPDSSWNRAIRTR